MPEYNNNKLYKYVSVYAIALLLIERTISKVFDVDFMPRYVKIFLIIIALMYGAIYWYKKVKCIRIDQYWFYSKSLIFWNTANLFCKKAPAS